MVDTTNTTGSNSASQLESAAAGAPEIEVTPEMIDAGEDVILSRGPHPEVAVDSWASSLASQVYQAMEAARCSKRNQ
jgi:hypothetical protein